MVLTRASRLFHTVRYLRPEQVFGRAGHLMRRVRPRLEPAPTVRQSAGSWRLRAWRAASMPAPSCLRFLNEVRELKAASDWGNPTWPRLWLYNLHYFDDLDAEDAAQRRPWHEALMCRWIAENPPPQGPGWEPYCLSMRIVNWCRWAWRGESLPSEAVQSLAVQARALADQVEVHLLGNHLFANGKALIFAGAFFEGIEGARWLERGVQILSRELAEQVLPDGGHFELSPMYHNIICGDVLELLELHSRFPQLLNAAFAAQLLEAAERMLRWSRMMRHPDGDVPFFNDAAFGIAPQFRDLEDHARALDLHEDHQDQDSRMLEASGYGRLARGPAVLFADVGRVGPDYLPGHAHADTLSFELSLFGQRFLVNTGTSVYAPGPERAWQRGTASHNTVAVADQDSSEVWSSFRVARRARPRDVDFASLASFDVLSASHDGYDRLRSGGLHRRTWRLSSSGLAVVDQLTGSLPACAYFYFHPDIEVVAQGGGRFRGTLPDGGAVDIVVDGGVASLEDSVWHPEFGRSVQNRRLKVDFVSRTLTTTLSWN